MQKSIHHNSKSIQDLNSKSIKNVILLNISKTNFIIVKHENSTI